MGTAVAVVAGASVAVGKVGGCVVSEVYCFHPVQGVLLLSGLESPLSAEWARLTGYMCLNWRL